MNNTKKLTTGAMLLAIVGALMLIDRQLSFLFEELIIMLAPAVIIIYSSMYKVKDGLILSISMLILTFLLGSTYSFCYMPISIIVGVGYSIGLQKNLDKTKLMIIAMGLYVLGEVVVTFIVSPILGIDIVTQISNMKDMYTELMNKSGYGMGVFDQLGVNLDSLLLVGLVISTIFMGIAEGFIIHILSLFLLTRFKIKEVVKGGGLVSFNLHPVVAYVSFLSFMGMFFVNRIDNQTIKLIIISLAMIGTLILIYFGYGFAVVYLRLITGKKSTGLLVILGILFLFPLSLIILTIIGFLYGAGPLKNKLIERSGKR